MNHRPSACLSVGDLASVAKPFVRIFTILGTETFHKLLSFREFLEKRRQESLTLIVGVIKLYPYFPYFLSSFGEIWYRKPTHDTA
jgi:hypothetical protein